MPGWFSAEDLFVAGAGFDIAGAVLVGRGLLVSPFEARRRSGTYAGWNSADLVAAAKDRADGIIGILSLIAGFALQGTAYLVAISGVEATTGSVRRVVVAVAILLVCIAIPAAARRGLGWKIMRPFTVEMARVRVNSGERSQADGRVLESVGRELGHPRLPDESAEAYAARVFRLGADDVAPRPSHE